MGLSGKIAVITGGNSGIGQAIARLFQQQGAHVVVTGRDEANLRATQQELGDGALAVRADVTRLADLDALYQQVKERWGRIDVLVTSAGVSQFRPIEAVDEAFFDELFDTNVKGTYFTVQKALPLMASGASIVLVSSTLQSKGLMHSSIYSATKAAVRSMGRTLAKELAPKGIRVNVLSPGTTDTPLLGKLGIPAEHMDAAKAQFAGLSPLARLGRPEEVAKAALFLASPDAGFVTAANLVIDGGFGGT